MSGDDIIKISIEIESASSKKDICCIEVDVDEGFSTAIEEVREHYEALAAADKSLKVTATVMHNGEVIYNNRLF